MEQPIAPTDTLGKYGIPRAFYRDDDPPPPPPNDPHRREWPDYGGNHEPVSRWLVYGLPFGLLALGVLILALKLVLLALLLR